MTKFISKESILKIHKVMIDTFGGSHGVRDESLLDSAIYMPESGFCGILFHQSLFDKASAYLYHLAKNHPFIDGNKRIALACTETFLRVNGYKLKKELKLEIYDFVIEVASSHEITKEKIALFLESNSEKI